MHGRNCWKFMARSCWIRTMVSSTASQGSSVDSGDSEWGEGEDLVGDPHAVWWNPALAETVEALKEWHFASNEGIIPEGSLPEEEEDETSSVVGQEIHFQSNHERSAAAVDGRFDERLGDENPPNIGPEVLRLAQHILRTALPEHRERASTANIAESILNHVAFLRLRGFQGTTAEDVVGNFNACLRGEVPLSTCANVPPLTCATKPPASNQASTERDTKWKIKNRRKFPTGYKKGPKKEKDSKKKADRKRNMSQSHDDYVTKIAKRKKDDNDDNDYGDTGVSAGIRS